MSCKLLTHPSYTWAVNLFLTGPSGSSAIPPIIIYSVAVITWVFAVFLCPTALAFWPKAFPALFPCPDSLISHPFLNFVNANWLPNIQNLPQNLLVINFYNSYEQHEIYFRKKGITTVLGQLVGQTR
jgi:hypothetical protein